jgi:hypothetical protein
VPEATDDVRTRLTFNFPSLSSPQEILEIKTLAAKQLGNEGKVTVEGGTRYTTQFAGSVVFGETSKV